ncbi:polysaccharide biosynthesis protein GumN [Rhizobium sp. KAs_5_22]|uniref:TraB/GumN family protein n=1 Tax=Ciceribacter selenitireducens TaxID=448181 RepID=UPI0004921A54|nr:TraB/GumN family protein [Ciceribacter selenitireducens]PPJ45316.1 polysaccharide biosynthesis protein GumN [Rhizobium sp. KAs_5_22]
MIAHPFDRLRQRNPFSFAGDAALWLIAALHVALLVATAFVLFSVSPARAGEPPACTGEDLLPALQKTDPTAYDKIVAKAAKTPNGKGIFWKIEKAGLSPSYLLGTMHVTDPRVLAMPKGASEAAADASTIVIESDEILDEKKAAAAMLMHPELTMFMDGTTIRDHLSAEDAEKLETGLKARGLALAAVARMKPWILSSFVALPACEIARKAAGASFLDKHIAENAIKAGKKVVGLETLAEQLQAMAGLPVEFHLQALIETLELGDKMDDVIETMTALYLAGDTGMTMPMLEAVAPSKPGQDESAYAAFEKRIVTDRNRIMAERAAPLLADGKVFIAVGALHLSGEQGLIELLRKQGFTVSAVNG